jgi:hypothetical protein
MIGQILPLHFYCPTSLFAFFTPLTYTFITFYYVMKNKLGTKFSPTCNYTLENEKPTKHPLVFQIFKSNHLLSNM